MKACISSFESVAGTSTHVLLDSWYCTKVLWKAARARDFLFTTELKSNRWQWQHVLDYTARLLESSYKRVKWPNCEYEVYMHIMTTHVCKLYQCQVVIVLRSLDTPLSQARFRASSDLEADLPTLLMQIATRWKIEVLFGNSKE